MVSIVVGVVFLVGGSALAMENPMQGIEIVSVKKIEVRKNSQDYYYLHVIVNMRNGSGSDIKLKENDFDLAIGAERKDENSIAPRYIGKTSSEEIFLKNVTSTDEEGQPIPLVVGLGDDKPQVLKTLAFVTNTVGDPANKVSIAISGKTKTWKQVEKGWISPGPLEMELVYHPKIEREVLLE